MSPEPVCHAEGGIVGRSTGIQRAVGLARRFAPTPLSVLIVGATGTGKELLAQAVHAWSGRPGPLVDVDCGALPRDLVDGILFGHRRGAFTGAVETVQGLVEYADRGTLFLDELGSLSLEAQAKLLRVLETSEVRRLGDLAKRAVDFRVVAALQDEPIQLVRAGRLRADLAHRLAGVRISLPPLASRGNDVIALAESFAAELGRWLDPGAGEVLLRHGWPGNIRELRAAVSRSACLSSDPVLSAAAIAEAIGLGVAWQTPAEAGSPAADLLAACKAHQYDPHAIARSLGVRRTKLYQLLREAGISLRTARRKAGLAELAALTGADSPIAG